MCVRGGLCTREKKKRNINKHTRSKEREKKAKVGNHAERRNREYNY